MKKLLSNSVLISALMASTFMLAGCEKEMDSTDLMSSSTSAAKAAAETAQSIMVDINVNAPAIDAEGSWKFDNVSAAAYFTGGTAQSRNATAQSQKCTFLNGGVLEAKSFGKNNVVVPITTVPVVPKTAWTLTSTGDGATNSDVTVDITIAGQSVVVNKGRAKYSFTLLDDEGNPRISDLKVMVTGQEDIIDPAFAVEVGDEANNCLADVLYSANAGTFGRATDALLTDMTMGEIIAQNAFSSTSACGNASVAKLDQLDYSLPAGAYTVTVTGTVKGNAGMASTPFAVTQTVTVGKCE
ncbi:hypothetical protein [Pontibacter flavimaris]|uniref:DUF4625 domain-containing protein n=1 Tax=Pontibacter flavimaris TaxID=1797110 RepID=A0A1Q5PH80_9BACT|nr:hypothetical protein [Pontibacter flavimaris]OKL41587.1 hypothetical protein A3841_11140 [Pontibacter flavimaris]